MGWEWSRDGANKKNLARYILVKVTEEVNAEVGKEMF